MARSVLQYTFISICIAALSQVAVYTAWRYGAPVSLIIDTGGKMTILFAVIALGIAHAFRLLVRLYPVVIALLWLIVTPCLPWTHPAGEVRWYESEIADLAIAGIIVATGYILMWRYQAKTVQLY